MVEFLFITLAVFFSNTDGLENVKAGQGRRHDEAGNSRMPVNLFDVLQTLVDEEQLRRKVVEARIRGVGLSLIILFDGQVPKHHL